MKSIKKCLMLMALVCFASAASAAVYQLGPAGDDLIGSPIDLI
jgi:hypothetical protein